jgi:hypothetical protein
MTFAVAAFLSLGPALSAGQQKESFPGFGGSVLAVGDVDGDKLGDLLVLDSVGVGFGAGGWLPGPHRARAWIVSPAAGRVLFDFGARESSWQSLKHAAVGDVDGDGFAELAVGAPGASREGLRVGAVHIVRVRDGSIVSSVWGDAANQGFGESVIALGDLDGDGLLDFVCADYRRGVAQGQVDVVSGAGKLFWSSGESSNWYYGCALDVLGDVDGAGRVDIAVGVDHTKSWEDGVLYVLDARSGRTIAELRRRGDDLRVWKPELTPSKPK